MLSFRFFSLTQSSCSFSFRAFCHQLNCQKCWFAQNFTLFCFFRRRPSIWFLILHFNHQKNKVVYDACRPMTLRVCACMFVWIRTFVCRVSNRGYHFVGQCFRLSCLHSYCTCINDLFFFLNPNIFCLHFSSFTYLLSLDGQQRMEWSTSLAKNLSLIFPPFPSFFLLYSINNNILRHFVHLQLFLHLLE